MGYRVFVLNGPNLNMLGRREPAIYGRETLADAEQLVQAAAGRLDCTIAFRQSNHEGVLIDWIHEAGDTADGIILNAGAYTHTSVALRDALKSVGAPTIEVHISNIHAREGFRHHSFISPVAVGLICGFGLHGYELALQGLTAYLSRMNNR